MNEKDSRSLVKGGLLLTLAGFIGKMLSAAYRIPLQNLTGDTGFYIYQQVYPILGMAMIFGLYAFPSAVSKLLTGKHQEKNQPSAERAIYGRVWLVLLLINGLFFLMLYKGADQLALMAGDKALREGYRMTAYVFLFIPFTALLRGTMQAQGNMQATAYSQVAEQLVRAVIIMLGAYAIVSTESDLYEVTRLGALAQMVGAGTAILVLIVFWKKTAASSLNADQHQNSSWCHIIKVIGGFGLLAALNHMILIVIQAVDMISLVPQLQTYGMTQAGATKAKGIFDRGQPLIQLGTVLGSSFALALVPAAAKQTFKQSSKKARGGIHRALALSFYLAGGATIGLVMIFTETNILLFENNDGIFALRILALALLLSSVAITGVSILQSAGFLKWTAALILGTSLAKWIGNIVLVPLWGLTGSAVATVASLGLLTAAVVVILNKHIAGPGIAGVIHWRAFVVSGAGMTAFLALAKFIFPFYIITSRMGQAGYVAVLVGLGAFTYITGLIRQGALDADDINMLPFASQLAKFRKG